MKHRTITLILALLLVLPIIGGCSTQANSDEAQMTITDLYGREVTVPASVDSVVAIGPGALRLYCYAGSTDYVVGIEEMDTGEPTGKPYMIANPSLAELPVIGLGGPNNAPDPEKILTVKPDVIFSTYSADAAAADELQAKTGIPVVAISYGKKALYDPSLYDSLELIGKITGQTTKAQAAIDFIKQTEEDLANRTKDIADADKPTVYVGGLGAKGAHGIESTQGQYALLDAINALNVVDETGKSGSVMIDKEKLLDWDPDFIFIDQGGYASVLEDYQQNNAFYNSLSAVKNSALYAQLPYNYYSTNIGTAIADAYYLGKILYPAAFEDIDPAVKADEIYQALLGAAAYERMATDYGGFRELNLE